ncbi:MAG: hypothetical protein GY722_25900 [bacterium]|nr:hypothetical protein [bacterium]
MKPGQRGTKKLSEFYGDQLVCVRYRYDEKIGKRFKTAELIVEETEWRPKGQRPRGASLVALRIDWDEYQLRRKVKGAGGKWDPVRRVWELRHDRVVELGLERRIVW